MKAKLILEDGTIFEGKAFGYLEDSVGEVVFNTSMTGYGEVLTDPSYYGQIVTMTYPLIGNYVVKKTTGKTIPRGSTVQGKHGKYVSRKNLKKGDLVFFATTGKGRVSHAGIYLGNKKFIHASSSKGKVVISSMASGHYYKTFVNGRRVI